MPYLFSLLGIVEGDDPLAQMDGEVKKRRTLEAIKRIVLRESLNQPLVVEFEDLHWVDSETQGLLDLLADSIATAKILLLVNYRPEYSHQWNSKTYYTQLRLDPLGKESAEEMLSALLGDGRDLIPLKGLIIERTEGTPFFMEEIVQTLFEDGVLQRNGAVKLARSMNVVKVPATVQAVLVARIDRLPAEEKELLQTLAVLGREFSLGLVQRVTLRPDQELERMLSWLQAGEFIYEQPAVGDTEYIFKHALTQEVATTRSCWSGAGNCTSAPVRRSRRSTPVQSRNIWTNWRVTTRVAPIFKRRRSICGWRDSRRGREPPTLRRLHN